MAPQGLGSQGVSPSLGFWNPQLTPPYSPLAISEMFSGHMRGQSLMLSSVGTLTLLQCTWFWALVVCVCSRYQALLTLSAVIFLVGVNKIARASQAPRGS